MTRKVSGLERQLRRSYGNAYRASLVLAQNLGLDFKHLSNIDVIVPELINTWKGNPSPLHLFLTLLEEVKVRKEIE